MNGVNGGLTISGIFSISGKRHTGSSHYGIKGTGIKMATKQELLDLASDFESADSASLSKDHDDRAPENRVYLPAKYVRWVVKALRKEAETK